MNILNAYTAPSSRISSYIHTSKKKKISILVLLYYKILLCKAVYWIFDWRLQKLNLNLLKLCYDLPQKCKWTFWASLKWSTSPSHEISSHMPKYNLFLFKFVMCESHDIFSHLLSNHLHPYKLFLPNIFTYPFYLFPPHHHGITPLWQHIVVVPRYHGFMAP